MNALFACATNTTKADKNQDYFETVFNENLNIHGVIVADGIGSHYKSELASKFCCEKLKDLIESISTMEDLDLTMLFKAVKTSLLDFAQKSEEIDFESINKSQALGTTLICALDIHGKYIIAYVGNGSIWHIDGKFASFPSNYYLPWNSINLLNPHCIEQEGKSALYRYMSISDVQYRPTVIELHKNALSPGEVIIITTDGIYTQDAIPVAKDGNNTLWIRGEESLPLLYSHLKAFLQKSDPLELSDEDVSFMLGQFLEAMLSDNIMHDDTTLGMIISANTLEYYKGKYDAEKNLNKQNEADYN